MIEVVKEIREKEIEQGKEKRNVPEMRFKGFKDEWEEKKLGDIVEYKKGYAFKTINYLNEGIRIIKISDTTQNSVKVKGDTFIDISDSIKYDEWKLKCDDILVSTVGSRPPLYSSMVGKIILVPKSCEGSLLNQNLVKLIPKNNIENKYLYNVLNKKKYLMHIENICRGNANQVSITLNDLFEYKVNIPSLQEQKKIAEFLSLVDKKIEKQSEKVEALKTYKKGMMQKIFKQEIRFKDENGEEYSEWEEKKLGEVTKLTDGVHFTPEYVKSGVPFWSVETIVSNAKPKYITKEANELANRRCKPSKNDILMTRIGTLGKSKVLTDDNEINIYVSVALIKSSKFFNSFFLKQYFDSSEYYKEFLSKSLLTAIPKKINMDNLKQTKIKLPCLEEQIKIANFLTTLDKKIEKEEDKLEELKVWKKGLLQKMFV